MARNRKQGFTLIELIVVIAIIGVLAAILVPSIMGYVKKSKRTADISCAKAIYDGVTSVLVDNEDVSASFANNQNSTFPATVNLGADNAPRYIVCYKDGASNAGGNHPVWGGGSTSAKDFEDALNNFLGTDKSPIKYVQSSNGKPLNRWFVCAKDNSAEEVEIWVGSGASNTPMFRLWPDTSSDYA